MVSMPLLITFVTWFVALPKLLFPRLRIVIQSGCKCFPIIYNSFRQLRAVREVKSDCNILLRFHYSGWFVWLSALLRFADKTKEPVFAAFSVCPKYLIPN